MTQEPPSTSEASPPDIGAESPPAWLPPTILLLGTDAAGKNHVARVWHRRLSELGYPPVVVEGWLSGSPAAPDLEDDKSWLSHLAEATFLRVFPMIAWALPWALHLLIRRDIRRFNGDGRHRLVVSHSALRILAFCLGARGRGINGPAKSTRRAVRELRERSHARVIVLDVDPEVRRRRIEARLERGSSDPFDRYMLADSVRSERIEACLVSLAVELMDAHLVINDALDDDAVWNALLEACKLKES